ncbi:YncE family protein [Pseudomonas sp. dw_358]|uniref:WD40 repeat domain-containing protein n=1 Tax=Pseudomonas sp. dw_358 TaxID=2720083 RepID=UPI001C4A6EAE|nr:YncE family protein [Pseudomonas sp. dw_358]
MPIAPYLLRNTLKALGVPALLLLASHAVHAADWIVSSNDGKYQRVQGRDTYPEPARPDSLTVLDASVFPPRVAQTVPVENGIQGPPQAAAISHDGKLALVAAPTRYDHGAQTLVLDTFLQVVDLSTQPATVSRVDLGSHPQAVAFDRSGQWGMVTCVDGGVRPLRIEGNKVTVLGSIKLGEKRLAGVAFTHDGQHVLASLRDEQGLAVLDLKNGQWLDSGDRVSTGVAPYTVDVSSDGHWAVVSNVGLAGLAGYKGRLAGDADSVTLIDVSKTPFRAVQQITVPSVPEAVAISPDGHWIAAQSIDGSNLLPDNPGFRPQGRVTLFKLEHGHAEKVNDVADGNSSQGMVFSADGKHLIVQFNVEKQLGLYSLQGGRLVDTHQRIKIDGGPSSLRSAPR